MELSAGLPVLIRKRPERIAEIAAPPGPGPLGRDHGRAGRKVRGRLADLQGPGPVGGEHPQSMQGNLAGRETHVDPARRPEGLGMETINPDRAFGARAGRSQERGQSQEDAGRNSQRLPETQGGES